MDVIRAAFESWKSNPTPAAVVRLLEASQHLAFGVAFEILRHRHDAEDAAQRVLLEIQSGLAGVADADHFLRRVRLTAFRTALDARRGRRRRVDRERKAADMKAPPPIPDEVREAIHEAMAALDDESRALVIEHYFEKATLDEMGARRGVSGAAVWKRIEAIKGRLREGLAMAGLVAAASSAEACLEAATLAAPTTDLVSGPVLGGGLMATKASTVTAAVLVSTLTFAIGIGGGLAIQSSRPSESPSEAHFPRPRIDPSDRIMVSRKTKAPAAVPPKPVPIVESPGSRLELAREIWDQFKRPRFWKDPEAQDETLPKLKRLGPDLAAFFIEKFRDPGVAKQQKVEAVRLAVSCGGADASALIVELAARAPDLDVSDFLTYARISLLESPPPAITLDDSLRAAATTLTLAGNSHDRIAGFSILTLGKPEDYLPGLMEFVQTEPDAHMRIFGIDLLARFGGAAALAFLKERRTAIASCSSEAQYGADHHRRLEQALALRVERAIGRLESGSGK